MGGKNILVIGGGPTGMMAAGQAALAGCSVTLLEKMRQPGRKLSITGKGRCNLTNVADLPEFFSHFGTTGPFLRAAFDAFFANDLCDFMRSLDMDLNVERGGRVFPASGRAPDVTRTLVQWMKATGVNVIYDARVTELTITNGQITGVKTNDRSFPADAIILASGGASYPRTGSSGDGYELAASVGHTIVPTRPALVPLQASQQLITTLAGLELRNVSISIHAANQHLEKGPGEVSFTTSGITGPLVLSASLFAVDALREGLSTTLAMDLKPTRSVKQLADRLQRDAKARGQAPAKDIIRRLLPRELVPLCLQHAHLPASRAARTLKETDLNRMASWIKNFRIPITGHRSWDEAIITAGGVSTQDVDDTTMESTKVKGLYLAGEVLDIQANTGGYNLQAAFSTGYLAGRAAAGSAPDSARRKRPKMQATQATGTKAPQTPSRTAPTHAFLPMTRKEMRARGWDALDVILVTGDAYIDSPFIGVSVIGRVLEDAGYRVGIIAQPDPTSGHDITQLGEPRLFWGVTSGCIDSLVANRTATGKPRKKDDYTPGGINDRRPDRAVIVYSNLIRQHFKQTRPIVLGGIEASLRRIAHYDFWTNKIRRSILFDAKADYLLYGMAEAAVRELATTLDRDEDPTTIRGLCYNGKTVPDGAVEVPSFPDCQSDRDAFTAMFHTFYRNNDPATAQTLVQLQDSRYLIQNPPADYLTRDQLDAVHELPYVRNAHPLCRNQGDVRALDTIRCSLSTHRGCYGECNFCAITVHQGRAVRWRSEPSILKEARAIADHPDFKGMIQDVGGPTANMYGFSCSRSTQAGCCPDKRCLYPTVCAGLKVDHSKQLSLLRKLRKLPGVRQVVVASGIRYDMVQADAKHGNDYLDAIVAHHVSGQLKIAPEHSEPDVVRAMGKPGTGPLMAFKRRFDSLTKKAGKKHFLTYYLIAAHPGCTAEDMARLRAFATRELHARPEQVQIFTPTPSTYSTLMYWTERDPFTGKPCFVEKTVKGREAQKHILRVGKR